MNALPTFLQRYLAVLLVAVGGCASALLMYGVALNWEDAQLHGLVENAAEAQTDAIEERLQAIASELPALRGMLELQQGISQSEFEKITASTLEQFPMLYGIGWAPRVAAAAGDHFPVARVKLQQIGPAEVNLDLAAEPRRHETLLRATDTAAIAMSRQVRLQPDATRGVVLTLPVYRAGRKLPDVAARRTHLVGILIAAIDLESLFEDTVARLFWDQLDFVVREGGPSGDILHVHAPRSPNLPTPAAAEIEAAGPGERTMLRMGGQTWWISHAPSPTFMAAHASLRPLVVMALGLLLTAVTLAYVMLVQRRHREVEALVALQTASLRESEARYRDLAAELRLHHDHLAELVTEQTQDLVAAKEAAERANQAKSDFLTKMSHELRTPMHAILSFACIGLLKADKAPPDRLQTYFQSIRGSCERLLAMVNDLLDLSKLEAGRMSYDMQRCDLRACCEEVRGEVASLLEGKALRVAVTVRTEDCQVYGDPVRLAQVLRNLLGNAIKFSPAGSDIEVVLEAATLPAVGPQAAPRLALRLSVADRGAGIAADELESIFDDFMQGSRRQAEAGGTGLGLAICREIVLAHHGEIHARNLPAGGAVFEVLLPREESGQ